MLIENLKRLAFYSLLAAVASMAFSISLFEITAAVFVISTAWTLCLERDASVFRGKWMLFLALFFAANLLSITRSQYPGDSWKGMFRVLRLSFFLLAVLHTVNTEEKFFKVFKIYLLVAFVIGLDGLIQHFTGIEWIRHRSMTAYREGFARVTSTFGHANDFSAYITLAFFFFAGVLVEDRNVKLSLKERLFCLAGAATLFLCLLWTYSRGAWLAVAVSLFLFFILKKKKVLLGSLIAVLVWAAFFSPPLLRERVGSLWDPKNGTVTERMVLMQESFQMIQKSPWLGLGLNTFSDNAPLYKSKTHYTDVQYAHNGYLQMMVETGTVGLAAFFLLIFYFLAATVPLFLKKEPARLEVGGLAIVFGVIAFLIHSATDTNLHSLLLVSNLWFCLGLGLSATELLKKKRKSLL